MPKRTKRPTLAALKAELESTYKELEIQGRDMAEVEVELSTRRAELSRRREEAANLGARYEAQVARGNDSDLQILGLGLDLEHTRAALDQERRQVTLTQAIADSLRAERDQARQERKNALEDRDVQCKRAAQAERNRDTWDRAYNREWQTHQGTRLELNQAQALARKWRALAALATGGVAGGHLAYWVLSWL